MSGIMVLDAEAETDDAIGTIQIDAPLSNVWSQGSFFLTRALDQHRIKLLRGFETCSNYQDLVTEEHSIHLQQVFFP